ncbi:MAG: hypothetical protein ACI89J_001864 [Hyphomicrobiaceae bacterium]|jgi:uncharacterized protein (DUF1499 family)
MALGFSQRRLMVSGWAVQIAGYSIILIVAASVLHRLFGLATPVALNLYLLAFIGAGLAIVLAGYALLRIWQGGHRGTGSSLVAIALSSAILMWPLSMLPKLQSLPNINDVSTDTISPPPFVEIAKRRPAGSNPIEYDNANFAEVQEKAYPDLRTLPVERSAAETVTLVAQALRKLRMEVVREAAPDRSTGLGFVEAVDRTLVFGFYDDVVVRVAENGVGALVDVRSASRFGQHDLGANATRVRKVLTALVERIQATVPKKEERRKRRKKRRSKNRSNRS